MFSWFVAVLSAHPLRVIFLMGVLGFVIYGIGSGRAGRVPSAIISACWLIFYAPLIISILFTGGGKIFASPPSVALLGTFLILTMVALAAFFRGLGLQYAGNSKPVDGFWDCLYFAIITWTTVGYGDIVPSGKWARAGAAYAALLGYFTMAALVAVVSGAMIPG